MPASAASVAVVPMPFTGEPVGLSVTTGRPARRFRMPVRSTIHSSVVSNNVMMSWLVTIVLGKVLAQPVIAQPCSVCIEALLFSREKKDLWREGGGGEVFVSEIIFTTGLFLDRGVCGLFFYFDFFFSGAERCRRCSSRGGSARRVPSRLHRLF